MNFFKSFFHTKISRILTIKFILLDFCEILSLKYLTVWFFYVKIVLYLFFTRIWTRKLRYLYVKDELLLDIFTQKIRSFFVIFVFFVRFWLIISFLCDFDIALFANFFFARKGIFIKPFHLKYLFIWKGIMKDVSIYMLTL